MKEFNQLSYSFYKVKFTKLAFIAIIVLISNNLKAQTVSGGWDAAGTNGTTGYTNYGSGVIQLLGTASSGCAGSAVHETSSTYDPTSGTTFSKCYKVYFGCPGNDNIGSDANGDGMAFSFSKGAYNINNGNACGGGLGYMGCAAQMITIEFDTWSSQGNTGFDASYGGGGSGNHDEIAIHRDGIANDGGRLTSVDAGNLEDGLEHQVCITYVPGTHVLSVAIDGTTLISYDLGATYNLQSYFGAGGLNQTWSSGKAGATNPATVSDGANIATTIGAPLCPANVVITSPSDGASFSGCPVGPITITASTTPPAGNTVSFVEFFVDGVSIGTDNTASYSATWNNPTNDSHAITAVAHYTPSSTSSTSATSTITVSPGIQKTITAPTIDGSADLIWGNYATSSLTKVQPIPGAVAITGSADLSATFQTMRDANYLYVLVIVTDNTLNNDGGNPWDNDGVELMIDMGNNKAGSYGGNDFQYNFGYNSATITEYKHNAITSVTFAQGTIAGGYTMEIRIPWTTLGSAPLDGDLIGFELEINDDDDGGNRDSKISWNDNADQAFNNPSVFGTLLAAACSPCPTGVLSGSTMVCKSTATSPLSVSLTGTSPWTIVYSIDGVNQPAISGINVSPYVFQSATGAHTYALVSVSNAVTSGCTGNATGTATITINSNLPVVHDGKFTPPGTATLSVNNTAGPYTWYDAPVGGNLVFTGAVFTTPVLNDTTKYYVQDDSGIPCRVVVKAIPEVVPLGDFFIPNLITPNSDGKNDKFEILALPNGSSLNIFNRWGERIYQSSDYDNLWAGTDTSDGVYYYDLVLPDGDHYKGWLNIVR